MFLLYNFVLNLLMPFWIPWMLFRTWQRKEQPIWAERWGNYPLSSNKDTRRVWFHAVSVGEVLAAQPILREVRRLLPNYEIVLSVTTSSGHQTAREQVADLYDHLVYFPIDIMRSQLAAMQRVRPKAIVIMETELWMNFLWAAKVFDAKTMLVNGRISDRSFPRAKLFTFVYRTLLAQMDRCLMQSRIDADRIEALGARSAEVFGNCKFDQALEGLEADPEYWREELGLDDARPTLVVGSIRAEEFDFLGQALKLVKTPGVQVVAAPRHLERVPELAKALSAEARRSEGDRLSESNVLILDTYGELANVYSVADAVIVGGGFADLGGQNIIQPLAQGKPVLHGPYMQNFRDVAAMADREGATRTCRTPDDLAAAIDAVLGDEALRTRMGEAARKLVASNAGASKRYAEAIARAALGK